MELQAVANIDISSSNFPRKPVCCLSDLSAMAYFNIILERCIHIQNSYTSVHANAKELGTRMIAELPVSLKRLLIAKRAEWMDDKERRRNYYRYCDSQVSDPCAHLVPFLHADLERLELHRLEMVDAMLRSAFGSIFVAEALALRNVTSFEACAEYALPKHGIEALAAACPKLTHVTVNGGNHLMPFERCQQLKSICFYNYKFGGNLTSDSKYYDLICALPHLEAFNNRQISTAAIDWDWHEGRLTPLWRTHVARRLLHILMDPSVAIRSDEDDEDESHSSSTEDQASCSANTNSIDELTCEETASAESEAVGEGSSVIACVQSIEAELNSDMTEDDTFRLKHVSVNALSARTNSLSSILERFPNLTHLSLFDVPLSWIEQSPAFPRLKLRDLQLNVDSDLAALRRVLDSQSATLTGLDLLFDGTPGNTGLSADGERFVGSILDLIPVGIETLTLSYGSFPEERAMSTQQAQQRLERRGGNSSRGKKSFPKLSVLRLQMRAEYIAQILSRIDATPQLCHLCLRWAANEYGSGDNAAADVVDLLVDYIVRQPSLSNESI